MSDYIIVSPEFRKAWLKEASPSLFLLYSAAWRAGYTVNGMKP